MDNTKYIFVVGGVMSSVGKGVAAASIGKLLQSRGFTVSAIKIDPYINVDAGTMNPTEHGEVFVTEDGDETDQDLGNYERFLDVNIYSTNYMTTGRVYQSVIEKERNLQYNGKCVEVVPHIPEEINGRIERAAANTNADVMIVEIGGTVGEYQNVLFLEAARIMKRKHPKDVLFVLVSFLPVPSKVGEMKTKPTQHACRTVNSVGIQPDIILCRANQPIDDRRKEKIGVFCNVEERCIVSAPDVDSIYEIPINFEKEGLSDLLIEKLNIQRPAPPQDLGAWSTLVNRIQNPTARVKVGIVGKYFESGDFVLADSYISVLEAVKHAAWSLSKEPEITWLNAEQYEQDPTSVTELSQYDAIIVPGGFGGRGVEGKIKAIQYCREQKIPFLGLCLGMQLAVVEYARHVAGIFDAHSEEMTSETENHVIHIMPEQMAYMRSNKYGGTMRLGAYPCVLQLDSLAYKLYGKQNISERHRHRFEFNNAYRKKLTDVGLVLSGTSPDENLVEIVELPEHVHPFFIAVQFHPEFKSRPLRAHPLFVGLLNTKT